MLENIPRVTVLIALILACSHIGTDYIPRQFAIGLALCSFPIAMHFSKRMGTLFGCLVGYTLIHSVSTVTNFYNRNNNLPFELQNSISISAAFSLLYLMIVFLGVYMSGYRLRSYLRSSFGVLVLINSLYVINSWRIEFRLLECNGWAGLLDYCGMSGTWIALGSAFLIPSVGDRFRWLKYMALAICFTGICLSKSAIPFGVFGVVLSAGAYMKNRDLLGVAMAPIAIALIAGFLIVGPKMADSSGRFQAYKVFGKFLASEKKVIFGTGLGSLRDLAPSAQSRERFMMNENGTGWLWDKLHSDILQSWFEMGLVFFIMILGVYFQCMRRFYLSSDVQLFSFGIGLLGAASINYPVRYFILGLMIAFFFVEGLTTDKHRTESCR